MKTAFDNIPQIFQVDSSNKTNEMFEFNRNEIELKAKFTVVYLAY